MPVKKLLALLLAVALGVLFSLAQEERAREEKQPAKITEEIQRKSLVRTDLLEERTNELKPLKRNIFSPHRGHNPNVGPPPQEVQRKLEEMARKIEEDFLEDADLDLVYIGFINSGNKIVALIIFEDETLAVEEGEMISPDLKIGKVTPQMIEILGPGQKKREFPLEGEGL